MGKTQTANVKPNADIDKGLVSTAQTHYTEIDEISPNINNYVQADYYTGSAYDTYEMQNVGPSDACYTKIEVKTYAQSFGSTCTLFANVYVDGEWLGEKSVAIGGTASWKSFVWDNLIYGKSDIDGLRVRIEGYAQTKTSVLRVYSLYGKITYTQEWWPSEWTIPYIPYYEDYTITCQNFLWHTDNMYVLKAMGGSYLYEVRRNIDVWDFIQPGPLCNYCFYEYSTNLPDLIGLPYTQQEESDIWLRICCSLFESDEESELRTTVSPMLANYWYNVTFKFIRRHKNKSFTLWTESERCGGEIWEFCKLFQDFEWFRMTTSEHQS